MRPSRRSFLAGLSATVATGAEPIDLDLTIDAGAVGGEIRALHGVNSGPLTQGGTLDLTPAFRALAPPLVRLHDCHWPNPDVVDLHVVFPDPRADPTRPDSYDFTRTDEYLQAIVASGAGIVYRLGESIEHHKIKRHVHPPKDPARWAAACLGVVRHYLDGWANGPRYPIRYWEVWNEPDNRPAMWTGSDDNYFRLYSLTARAIKKAYPRLLVGGPGLGNTGDLKGDTLTPAPFLRRFLDHCRRDALPLDFFSWHCYSNDAAEMTRRARAVRRLLDDAGFARTESHLNEWNYLPDNDWAPMLSSDARTRQRWYDRLGAAEGAAFAAANLLRLQDAPLDAAQYFAGEAGGMGLFSCHGLPRKSYHALRACRLLAAAPRRVRVTGTLPAAVAACAGLARDGRELVLLLSAGGGSPLRLRVRWDRLPWPAAQYEVLLVDETHDLEAVAANRLTGDRLPAQRLAAPAVCLVRLRATGG